MQLESDSTMVRASREGQNPGCEHSAASAGGGSGFRGLLEHRRYYLHLLGTVPYGIFRRLTRKTAKSYGILVPYVAGMRGLEIGGPSPFFRKHGLIPVYNLCQSIDSCNFSDQTIWTAAGDFGRFGAPVRSRHVAEASDLSPIPDASYDFVLASHVLEHIANPLRALREWSRVLKPGGALVVIVPDKRNTSDHKRPYTSFDHLEQDFRANTTEDDLSHLPEVLALHDVSLEHPGVSWPHFEDRCRNNFRVRGMHHHVFSADTLTRALTHARMRVMSVSIERPIHIVAFAQRSAVAEAREVPIG